MLGLATYETSGNPKAISNNFLKILEKDAKFNGLVYNSLSCRFEQNGDKWGCEDMAEARNYIEYTYGIRHMNAMDDALLIYQKKHQYNPVKKEIEAVVWDGEKHCDNFLIKWLGCKDDAYHREVSRLIFAGGINRLYRPGCKYDTTPVLIGEQGCGKSTICKWLAIEDEYFGEISSFGAGRETIEALQGVFIGEIVELLALTRVKEQEAVKSFLTRQVDRGRPVYQKDVVDMPRQCTFIATTNKSQFISDKTGGRRWLPVFVNSNARTLYQKETEVKDDIRQCWAEALHLFRDGKMPCVADYTLCEEILAHQESVTEEDYRVGLIERYLDGREQVCVFEVWEKALGNVYDKPSRKDSNEVIMIMKNLGWYKARRARFGEYGQQWAWEPIGQLPF